MRLLSAALATILLATPAAAEKVTVFAAASLKTALDKVAADWEAATGNDVAVSYAGSSQLARQIKEGAPADLFISASPEWMDDVAKAGEIDPETRRDLLGNELVLVGQPTKSPTDADAPFVAANTDLNKQLAGGKLAMALVDSVPAGVYGKQALEALGLWDGVRDHVAQADNVRAVLALVATGEAPLGIVYATDAKAESAVSVVARFPKDSHDPIVYPVALTLAGKANPAAADLLAALSAKPARQVFSAEGFSLPEN